MVVGGYAIVADVGSGEGDVTFDSVPETPGQDARTVPEPADTGRTSPETADRAAMEDAVDRGGWHAGDRHSYVHCEKQGFP